MKPVPFVLLALISLGGCHSDEVSSPSLEKVTVRREPTPAPWAPPKTSIPKEFVEETAFLLQHGLGDPRGRTYGAANVRLGSSWGRNPDLTEIHGWISEDEPKRIVSLGGLVYDVAGGSGKASIQSDLTDLVGPAGPEAKAWTVLPGADRETATRLLLVLGDAEDAERLYAVLPKEPGFRRETFLVRWFHQAVEAHMAGDDATALRVGQAILRERPAHTARLMATVDPKTHALPSGPIVQGDPYAYLDVLNALVEDSERRLASPHKPGFDPKTASVAELIDHLDGVSARQWSQPGGVDLADDPIVAALGAKGAEAAEPLLDAMEKDRRLTRSVSFGRDFFPPRNLIPTRSAALAAFQLFAETDAFPSGSGAQLDVKGLRAYWEANKGKSAADRWLDTLADDKAGWRRWEEAARRLFDPQGAVRLGFSSRLDLKNPLKAETLRGRKDPSLADLLERRARDIMADTSEGAPGPSRYPLAIQFGLFLNRWEPSRSVDVLREASRKAIAALGEHTMMNDYAGTFVVPAIEARAEAGDATAWDDYRDLLSRTGEFPSSDSKILRPLAEHPEVPAVQAATRLLVTPGSPFDAIGRLRRQPEFAGFDPILVSPLLRLPILFDAVLKGLDDRTVIGTSHLDQNGNAWFVVDGKPAPAQGIRPEPNDPKPPAGQKVPLRMGDVVAHDLARLKGAPKFQPYWSVERKDAAVARMRRYLLANRSRITEIVLPPYDWKTGYDPRRGW